MKSVLNIENKTYDLTQPLFFGKGLSLQRYDITKHKRLMQNFKGQLELFWRPEEITLTADRNDFRNLSPHEQNIFSRNLQFQSLLDSVQTRILPQILTDVSNLELEACMTWWMAFEQMHSYAYTYIIKDIYENPSIIFDGILENEEIVKRATSVTKYYNDYINSLDEENPHEKKKKMYLSWISMNILEGIRFYVSFACSYNFAQNKKMVGNADIIRLINRDENIHLGMSQYIINCLQNDPEEGFIDVVKECEGLVYQMYTDAANEEIEWAEYLFKDGSMMGLNAEMLSQYMKYLTNRRLKAIGKKSIFQETTNPISWIKSWTDSDGVQTAPQEKQSIQYTVGNLKNNIDDVVYNF